MDVKDPKNFKLRCLGASEQNRLLKRDNLANALAAFARLRQRPKNYVYKTGCLGIADHHLETLADKATQMSARKDPEHFFETHFRAAEIIVSPDKTGAGLLTGFYEPEAEASRTQTPRFTVPLLARPDDLVEVDTSRGGDLPEGYRFAARRSDGRLAPYYDRKAIEAGALSGRGLELVWLEDPIDAFFIHIQGAALLHLTDGTKTRVTYAAKSGHPFTGIGKTLVDNSEIPAHSVSMQAIRAWLHQNPDHAAAMMQTNRSYIFFRETAYDATDSGPIAAAKVPLTPLRSIAVDRTIYTFGTPIFISSPDVNGARFDQLMIAQDTGTAIVGPARADLYFGTGQDAGNAAGGLIGRGVFTILIPKTAMDDVRVGNRVWD